MTHFVARFPQHSAPVKEPKPEDYQYAAIWYRYRGGHYNFAFLDKAEAFERVYRRLKWSQKKPDGRSEEEIA